MNDKENNKRQFPRHDAETIDDSLKILIIKSGLLSSFKALTVDASLSGIGFISNEIELKDIDKDNTVIVTIPSSKMKLRAKIAFISDIGNGKVRVGVVFPGQKSLSEYQKLLESKK